MFSEKKESDPIENIKSKVVMITIYIWFIVN